MIVTPFITLISLYLSFLNARIASSLCPAFSPWRVYTANRLSVSLLQRALMDESLAYARRDTSGLVRQPVWKKRKTHKWIDHLYIYFLFRGAGPYNKPRLSHENRYIARFWSETPAAREPPAHAKEKMSPMSRGSGGQSPFHHGRCGWQRWQRRWDLV